MDLGEDDQEEEEEEEGELPMEVGSQDSNGAVDEGKGETQGKVEPQRRRGRIVKVEEVKTVVLNRDTADTDQGRQEENEPRQEGEAFNTGFFQCPAVVLHSVFSVSVLCITLRMFPEILYKYILHFHCLSYKEELMLTKCLPNNITTRGHI